MKIEITEAEILADLTWPGPPPGEWPVPAKPLDVDAELRELVDQSASRHSTSSLSMPRS